MYKVHDFSYKKNRMQQIKGFYYTTRFRSISEAAKIMNLTQSTVTLQIQSLERDLGLKLFRRDSKPITLTEAGEEFYKLACPLMQEFESVVDKFLNSRNKSEEKTINIAVHHIAISYLMPRIIGIFKKSNPESKIIIRNIPFSEAIKRIKDNKIDLAFYPSFINDSEIKHLDTISYDPILIMNKNHPLSQREIKSLSDLKNFDLIRIDNNLIILPLFEEAIKKYNLRGSIEFENGNWEMLKHFVKDNDFVAVVSTICLDENDKNLVTKNLSKFFPKMNYSIIHKNGVILRSSVKDFITAINQFSETKYHKKS